MLFKRWRDRFLATILCGCVAVPMVLVGADTGVPVRDLSVSPMRQLIDTYRADLETLGHFNPVDISPIRLERQARLLRETQAQLEKIDFGQLDGGGQIDYLLLRNQLKWELRELGHQSKRIAEAAPLLPYVEPLLVLDDDRRAMKPLVSADAARWVTKVATDAHQFRTNLEAQIDDKTKAAALPGKVVARRAWKELENVRQSFRDWHDFHSGYEPDFAWWVEEAWQKANKELEENSQVLRKKLMGVKDDEDEPLIGDPIGRDALLESLEAEGIVYTPEELIEIANREFAWCEGQMKLVEAELGVSSWKEALAKVSEHRAPPGGQPAAIKELADEATEFVESRGLVTVPPLCKETWRMEMMTPARQKVNPYFTGGEVISVSYPTDGMSYEDKLMGMRGNNLHFSHATVHHELIPGHWLQAFMSARYQTHRAIFGTPFLVEGWALYWEMLLWDLHFARSPEDKVGMLFWRSHRCARIIFSLNFHLGKMTAPEAVDFLVDRVGHERRNATAEVRRSIAGDYSPLYQAAYMLGGLQLRALHAELKGKMSDREFHDAVLRENAIPIDFIRADLTHQTLTRDYAPSWRFYPLDAKPAAP